MLSEIKRGIVGSLVAATLALALAVWAPVAAASPGDVYAVDRNAETVWKLGPAGGEATVLASFPGTSPYGMTLGPDGFLYVADEIGFVWRVDKQSGAKTPLVEFGGPNPIDVAFDAGGRLFMVDYALDDIFSVDPASGARTLFHDGPTGGFNSLAFLRSGSLFVSDESEDEIYSISTAGARTTFATGDAQLTGVDGLMLSPDERYLFAGSFAMPRLLRYDLRDGTKQAFPLAVNPYSIAQFPDGRLLFSSSNTGELLLVSPSGGATTSFSADPDLSEPRDLVVEPTPCAGRVPTVVGTAASEVIRGSASADVISTLGGKDTVKSLGGNDVVCGGDGKDRLYGGKGKDKLLGQGGKDKLVGGKGKDKLKGGAGKDVQKQ